MKPTLVLIKGAGEMATAVAHRLHRCGFRVVMTETDRPTAVRRAVAFAEAVFEGEVVVEGVRARRWAMEGGAALDGFDWTHVPVFVDPECGLRNLLRPDVVVDARILKRNDGNARTDAPLVIGLGPGIAAGEDVHLVIETNRGHDLGRIIEAGFAEADTGIPGSVGGRGRERVLRAPVEGLWESQRRIADRVSAGDVVGHVGGVPVVAAIDGIVRGLIRDGLEVAAQLKLGDVDPRGDVASCFTISDKARTISGGVLEAILAYHR